MYTKSFVRVYVATIVRNFVLIEVTEDHNRDTKNYRDTGCLVIVIEKPNPVSNRSGSLLPQTNLQTALHTAQKLQVLS